MEIRITTKQILKILHILSWIIFIGLCIKAGGIIFNVIYVMLLNPAGAFSFWEGIDLSALYNFDKGYFLSITVQMSIVGILQCILFYLIIKMLHDKKLNLNNPFSRELKKLISNVSFLSLGIGIFSFWGLKNSMWIKSQEVSLPDIQNLGFGGADVWIFMGITLFVISQIFKRGIEIQDENELTI